MAAQARSMESILLTGDSGKVACGLKSPLKS